MRAPWPLYMPSLYLLAVFSYKSLHIRISSSISDCTKIIQLSIDEEILQKKVFHKCNDNLALRGICAGNIWLVFIQILFTSNVLHYILQRPFYER